MNDFFNNTKFNAKCTYQIYNKYEGFLEIWEVKDEDFEKMCDMTEEEFSKYTESGWWRYAKGSNMGVPCIEYEINGVKIMAWDGSIRENYYSDFCNNCSDRKNKSCNAAETDILECCGKRKYNSLLDYLWNEIKISQPKNICALTVDLAQYNHMTLGELFKRLQPEIGDGKDGQK